MEIAVLALGCFWGPEIKFSKINGVIKTEVGYCGGNSSQTTYKEVCTGSTNHAEVVQVTYDPKVISINTLLKTFWECHDPTQGMRQGNDIGEQYRSVIFCKDSHQLDAANISKKVFQTKLDEKGFGPITTEIKIETKTK